jgi:chemotaxis regulatin CheY-phosphate phosphatase CheZ
MVAFLVVVFCQAALCQHKHILFEYLYGLFAHLNENSSKTKKSVLVGDFLLMQDFNDCASSVIKKHV